MDIGAFIKEAQNSILPQVPQNNNCGSREKLPSHNAPRQLSEHWLASTSIAFCPQAIQNPKPLCITSEGMGEPREQKYVNGLENVEFC